MGGLTQLPVTDTQETPGLHQADARRVVRRFEQARQHFGRHLASSEVTHVATLGDGAVHRRALFGAEGVLAHGRNSAAAASGLDGR